jgi:hypothetical protein
MGFLIIFGPLEQAMEYGFRVMRKDDWSNTISMSYNEADAWYRRGSNLYKQIWREIRNDDLVSGDVMLIKTGPELISKIQQLGDNPVEKVFRNALEQGLALKSSLNIPGLYIQTS